MKTQEVEYSRTFNTGDYSNEKIGVKILVEPGDNVQDVIELARNYVTLQSKETKDKVRRAEIIVNNPDEHTGIEIKRATAFLSEHEKLVLSIAPKMLSMDETK